MKYHMKANGEPGKCTASVKNCPLGADTIHAESPQALFKAFEEKMKAYTLPESSKKDDGREKVKTTGDLLTDPYKGNTVDYPRLYHWSAWTSERNGCAYELKGEECTDGGYCHHQTHQGIRLKSDYSLEATLKEDLNVDEIPEEISSRLDFINPERNFVVERSRGYYGDDIEVRFKKEVQEAIDRWHYSRPNVASSGGALEFARINGIDTSGKTEVEAVRELAAKKLSKEIRTSLEDANSVSREKVVLDKIRFQKAKLDSSENATIPLRSSNGNNLGGVLLRQNGELVLVSEDYSRFKAIKESGRKTWSFLVLEKKDSQPSYWVNKEPLGPAVPDVSNW